MGSVEVDFQDGFNNDEVVISVDGQVVRRVPHVTSQLLLGFADSVEVGISGTECRLHIAVPARDLAAGTLARAGSFVGVSLATGELTLQVSDKPFGYA